VPSAPRSVGDRLKKHMEPLLALLGRSLAARDPAVEARHLTKLTSGKRQRKNDRRTEPTHASAGRRARGPVLADRGMFWCCFTSRTTRSACSGVGYERAYEDPHDFVTGPALAHRGWCWVPVPVHRPKGDRLDDEASVHDGIELGPQLRLAFLEPSGEPGAYNGRFEQCQRIRCSGVTGDPRPQRLVVVAPTTTRTTTVPTA
jgi:hypothetical protein